MVIFNLVTFLHVPRDQQTIIEPSPKFKEQEGKVYDPYFTDKHYKSLKIDVFSFIFLNFLLLFNYSCVPYLAIPPPHPSQTPLPPPHPPSPLILSMCPL